MKYTHLMLLLVPAFMLGSCKNMKEERLAYPVTAKVDTVDLYFGTEVPDPFRWLENDTSAETGAWVKAQNELTYAYLEKIPFRNKIKERLTELWDYPKQSTPFKRGERYFYFANDGIQNQDVLFTMTSLDAEPIVLLDPNTMSEDGTVALSDLEVSKDGKYLAYAIASAGSDWNEIQVMDIAAGAKLDDHIKWVKFSGIAWYKDGFYYSRYPEPGKGNELSGKNEFHKVYYHKLGTTQENDLLIYENKEFPQRLYNISVTEDESYLVLYEHESSTGNAFYVRKAADARAIFQPIVTSFDNINGVVDNIGDKLLVNTNVGAPRNRIVLVDPASPDPAAWTDIIPEKEEVLEGVSVYGGRIVANYMKDATSRVYIHSLDGTLERELVLPGLGSLGSLSGQKASDELFYSFTSFTFPSAIYRYDLATGEGSLFKEAGIDFDEEAYETRQVFYTSKDG
ncbi:MAG: S9 family peptidase, partial [Bacteroidales bacterium]|nr:S9 family peptidase [Bacteroidales bacterium]